MRDKTAPGASLKSFAEHWRETCPVLYTIRSRAMAALTEEKARQQTLLLLA